jgi:predicted ATPase
MSKQTSTISKLTVNKLHFASVGFYGRDNEAAILNECLGRLTSKDNTGRELVLVKGYSGTGKTSLVSNLANPVREMKGCFVTGKFNSSNCDDPYSGISVACRQICGEIMMARKTADISDRSFEEMRDRIVEGLHAKLHVLMSVIPDLVEIIGDEYVRDDFIFVDAENQGNSQAKHLQLKHAFRVFIRIVSSYLKPLVLLLDDLQWADVASLELLEVLVTDRQNPNLMIIGCYRSNEVEETHIISKLIHHLNDKCEHDDFIITEIEVENLGIRDVNQIIMALLSIDDESRTHGLAEICLKRTIGNPLFLLTLVITLEEQRLIRFNQDLLQWTWDESEIEEKTASTANVVYLIRAKMGKLPEDFCRLLQYAAFLGSEFDEKTIGFIWKHHVASSKELQENDKPVQLLSQAVEENFLEKNGLSTYRWVHNKIQEAAISLVPASSLSSQQFEIGMTLVRELG